MGGNFFHFCKEPKEKGEEGKQASIYDVHTPQTALDYLLKADYVHLGCFFWAFCPPPL